MAWRVLEVGDHIWNVSLAAERRPDSASWGLVLSFRAAGTGRRALWAPYPIESSSKSGLFAQAEQISDQSLAALLAEHLA